MKNQPMYKRYENAAPIGSMALCNTFSVLVYEPDEIDKYKEDCDLIAAWCNCGKVYGASISTKSTILPLVGRLSVKAL